EDHGAIRVVVLDGLHDVEARHLGHLQVDDREMDVVLAQLFVDLPAVREGDDAVPVLLEDLLDEIDRVLVVVDHEDSDVHRSPPSSQRAVKSAARPYGKSFLSGRGGAVNDRGVGLQGTRRNARNQRTAATVAATIIVITIVASRTARRVPWSRSAARAVCSRPAAALSSAGLLSTIRLYRLISVSW